VLVSQIVQTWFWFHDVPLDVGEPLRPDNGSTHEGDPKVGKKVRS
jgi:hypothetical protein